MSPPLLLLILAFLWRPCEAFLSWSKDVRGPVRDIPLTLDFSGNDDLVGLVERLRRYQSPEPDCFAEATAKIRGKSAIAMTLCEISTGPLASVPLECRHPDIIPGQCVEALARSPQFWTSFSGYFRDAHSAKTVYESAATDMVELIRSLSNKEQSNLVRQDIRDAQASALQLFQTSLEDIQIHTKDLHSDMLVSHFKYLKEQLTRSDLKQTELARDTAALLETSLTLVFEDAISYMSYANNQALEAFSLTNSTHYISVDIKSNLLAIKERQELFSLATATEAAAGDSRNLARIIDDAQSSVFEAAHDLSAVLAQMNLKTRDSLEQFNESLTRLTQDSSRTHPMGVHLPGFPAAAVVVDLIFAVFRFGLSTVVGLLTYLIARKRDRHRRASDEEASHHIRITNLVPTITDLAAEVAGLNRELVGLKMELLQKMDGLKPQ
ncbi:hypothetical protein C8R46DRAFT_1027724 [Mycena filopes]|nr:hypothetical protein C8R46DRAFT_1027724 [Mycena filopes]